MSSIQRKGWGTVTEATTTTCAALLQATVEESMQRNLVPGVVVAIQHGDTEVIAPFGVTNIEQPLSVDERTLFQIGSTTKTVTGTVMMRLVEQGKIDLDAPVRAYLPAFRVADEATAASVTVRHLMTHTAGWEGDFFVAPDLHRGEDALERIVEMLTDRPQLTPIGEVWAYNNAAFYVLGRIIEVITGSTYETAARELVLDPLGMKSSFFFPEEVMTYRFAVGHSIENDEIRVSRPWHLPRSANAAGGIVSSAADQLRYARFHMGDGTTDDGTRLLSGDSIALMQTPYATADNGSSIGLTWFIKDVGGVRTVSHGGTINGQYSEFLMAPEQRFAITVFTNGGHRHALGYEIVAWALREYLGIEDEQPVPLDLPEAEFAPYLGCYQGTSSYIELAYDDDGLMIRMVPTQAPPGQQDIPPAEPAIRAAMIGADRLMILDPPLKNVQGEFLRGADGDIAWMRLSKRIFALRR